MNTYLWYEKKNMKQLIKKIMVLFVMLFLFTGCINNKNDKKNKITSYLDTINMEDFEKMQRDNKTFLVYVGRPTCEDCQLFEDRFLEDIKDMEEFKKIKYFGSFWGMSKLKKLDLGNNPTLECVFLKNVDVEDDTIFENLNEINVSKCKNLRVIDIEQAGEKFTELDLSSNDKLNSLGLEGLRGLKQLKMPETDNLKEIVVKETALESLALEKYTKLDKVCVGGNQFNTLKINMEQKTEKDIENMYLLFDNNLKVEFISSKSGIVPNIKRLDNHNLWAGIVFSNYVVTDYEIPECW